MREPTPFGRYLLLERIGVGGMAEVFLARVREGEGAGRLVAVKRLLPHLGEDPAQVSRFLDEGRISRELDHPAIAAAVDLGREGAWHYIALEWVPGKDLATALAAERAAGRRIPVPLAALVGLRVFEALGHAHGARGRDGAPLGLVHRDVSPRNVLLSFAGEVKVADFGIASAAWRGGEPEVPRGRLAYRSPEQAAGRPAGPRSDLFSAAAMLYEMLAGERGQPPGVEPPSGRNPEVPPALDGIVLGALAPEPEARPESAASMAEALRPFAGPEADLARWLCGLFPEDARRERERLLAPGRPG